jgi:hypothetical protein
MSWAVGLVAFLLAIAGCGSVDKPSPEVKSRLQNINIALGKYASQNRGMTPANEAAFRAYLGALPEPDKEALKVTDVDALLTSPRDQKQFIVKYGQKMPMFPDSEGKPTAANVVAYEQEGAAGKRFVIYANGQIEEVDSARATELGMN